jgi:hypothetical protein
MRISYRQIIQSNLNNNIMKTIFAFAAGLLLSLIGQQPNFKTRKMELRGQKNFGNRSYCFDKGNYGRWLAYLCAKPT